MKKLWLILPLLVMVLLVGCAHYPEDVIDDLAIGDSGPKVAEGYAIHGRADIEGLYPGWSGTVPMQIINGEDRDRDFVISVHAPEAEKVTDGFEPLPSEYLDWVTIEQPYVYLAAGESVTVPIGLSMPEDADYKGKKAEVRVLVEDTTQTGLVQIALEAKWFITTAE